MNAGQVQSPLPLADIPNTVLADAVGLSFDQAHRLKAATPTQDGLQDWLLFQQGRVAHEPGNVLYEGDAPLRASRIQAFPGLVGWRYGFNFTTNIHSALGKKVVTPDGWRFPGLARYGLVIYQPTPEGQLRAWTVWESKPENPQMIELDPNQNIYINVNDTRNAYGDNNGSFELFVKKIG